MTSQDSIFILIHSLRYEKLPSQAQHVTRSQFYRMKEEQRRTKYKDSFIERVSYSKWITESNSIEREAIRQAYDKAIMKKYNVGPDYRQNRYFMEEVRPTL